MTPPPPLCPAYWKYKVTVADVSASQMKRFGHVLGSPCQNLCQPAQTSLLELTRPWIRERISLEVWQRSVQEEKEKPVQRCQKVSSKVFSSRSAFESSLNVRAVGCFWAWCHFCTLSSGTKHDTGRLSTEEAVEKAFETTMFYNFLINVIETPTRVVLFSVIEWLRLLFIKGTNAASRRKTKILLADSDEAPACGQHCQTRLVWPCWCNVSNNLCNYIM